jgi:hypothetical protein
MFTNQPVLWGESDTHTKAIREFSIENRKKGETELRKEHKEKLKNKEKNTGGGKRKRSR